MAPKKEVEQDDEPKRLTFWIGETLAKQIKRNAKAQKQCLPAYICDLVRAGLALEQRRSTK